MAATVRLLFFLLGFFGLAASTHFRGGIIQWRPVNAAQFDGRIEVTHRIAWRRSWSGRGCTQSTIDNRILIGGGSLVCRVGCSGTIGSLTYYCTDFSSTEDWSAGQRTQIYDMGAVTYFEASYSSGDWIPLVTGGGRWEIRVKGNLTRRADNGLINTSPISTMPPVVRLQQNCNHTIEIPVEDADGDITRCRWAVGSECAGVCSTFPGATLNECTLRYAATGSTGWYAVALQIEDFASPSDTVPLSSVPLQFLVRVFSSSALCASSPEFVEPTRVDDSCIGVPFNTTWHEPIIAQSGAEGVSITEITTASPPGLRSTALTATQNSRQWYINATWTPDESQYGLNIFCFSCMDSIGLNSEQSCIRLLGGVEAPLWIGDSISPTGEIFPNHTDWSIRFDKQILRSTRYRYIKIYEEGGTQVIRINAATSPSVIFPQGNLGRELRFRTLNFLFSEKRRYYVLLDPGVAVGPEFCGPESPAIRDPSFWVVTIADITPPTLTFHTRPYYSKENITISWSYDEEVSSRCTLQTPTRLMTILCNQTVMLQGLEGGVHSLFIQGTDLAGNTAATVRHTWMVDLTPPQVRLSSSPPVASSQTSWTFRFYCVNEWMCTYMCSLYASGSSGQYTPCSGSWFTGTLQNGVYVFAAFATDGVGNIGNPVNFQWTVDTVSPTISMVNDVSLTCGSDYSPSAVAIPMVTDNEDPNPSLSHQDLPSVMCSVQRVWTATDDAGNTATMTQIITFTVPQPPQITAPSQIDVPCGSVEDAIRNTAQTDLLVVHPCGRPLTITFSDSTTVDRCGFTFTRTWRVQDDCGSDSTFMQNIRVLSLQLPGGPENGQVNTRLDEPLIWPQFPGAYSYEVYVWQYGTQRPSVPTTVVSTLMYTPSSNYDPGTRYLWQIEYVTGVNTTVPSPIWGFETQSFPDLTVTTITVPPYAFSGQNIQLSWTVTNIGNLSSGVSSFYDAVYMGPTTDFSDSRRVVRIRQSRFVDPQDGYVSSATVNLENSDIGNFYLFVVTDLYYQVNDFDRTNNRRTSVTPVRVMLTPPPNLVVESVVAPSSTFSGQDISVRWTISNDGVGVTESNRWRDSVFWSNDELLDGRDLPLGSYVRDGTLAAGAAYSKTVTVSIPNAIYGNYTVIVVTDAFNEVYEHTTEDDNIGISMPVDVILAPPPDLIVSSLEALGSYATGDTLRVVFTVMNTGAGEPFERYWNDELVLTFIPSGRAYILSRSTHYGTLQPGDSYSNEVQYTISPSLQTGRYNLTAYTDYRNVVFEFNSEGNNLHWKEILIQEQLPDLVVLAATFNVQTDAQGNSIQVNYTVRNRGSGQSLGAPWTDKIGLSSSQIYSISSTSFIGELVRTSELQRDESFSATLVARVPRNVHGRLYLHVVTDFNRRIVEESETNNIMTTGPLTLPEVFPDLSVRSLLIPSGLDTVSGEEVLVNWTVANEGIGALERASWIDALYLDTTSQISSRAVKLADVAVSTSLEPQGTYSQSTTVLIPQSFAGAYYLILSVNNYAAIDENGILGNNVASNQLFLSTPPSPDLIVTSVSYVMTDRVLTSYWTILNNGNTMRRAQSWTDQVFLLRQPTFDRSSAIRLGQHSVNGLQLESSQEYRASDSFVIPGTISGYYYILIETDSANRVLEINGEDNNFRRTEDTVLFERLPTPMLSVQISSSNLPASLLAGQTVTFEYVISNTGEVPLSTSSWTDEIYLYPGSSAYRDAVLQDGVLLTQVVNNRELEVGESVTNSVNVTIPYGINQLMYFVVILDVNENLGDPAQTGYPGNLITGGNNRILVEQGPLSDLQVIPPSTNITLRGGQPTTLTYEVENMGENSAVGTWYEAIYLSRDAILDPFDTRLKSVKNLDNIEINGSYFQTEEVFIPFDLPSSRYYIFFQVDDGNRIIELDETNNVGQQIVSIQEAVSTDISVVTVTALPTNLDYGDDVNVQWEIRNNGSLVAEGYKCDTVYLSEDDKWDITDNQLGDPKCNAINIQPYEGNSANDQNFMLTEATPFITQQDYTGIVRTRSNIRDPDLENNIGSTVMPLSVNAPTLLLDTSMVIDLETGDENVYKIEKIPGESTLVATLSVNGIAAYHDLFLRYQKPPTGYDYDAFSQRALSSNQTAVVRNTRAGTYYLRIESSGREVQNYQVQVLVKIARFEILDTSPRTAAPLGSVTIFFSGTVFSYFVDASLFSAINPSEVYTASNVYWFNSEEVYATFDASVLPTGMYSAKLTDTTTGAVAQLNSSLEIAPGIQGQLSVLVRPPRPLRAGASGRVSLYIRNTGNTDILTPLMTLQTGGNALVRLLDENALADYATEVNFLPLPTSGPGGILPPGASTQAYFDVLPTNARVRLEMVQFSNIEDTLSAEPHAYLEQKSELKLPGVPDHVWDIVWRNFLDSVGETWGSLHERISEIATVFSFVQKKVFSWDEIISYQLQVANGFLTGNTLLVIEDITEEGSDSVLPLAIRREYSSYIHKRRTVGPMGMGWILPWWEMRVQSFSSEEVEMWNGRDLVTFIASDPGVYTLANDDTKVVTVDTGGVRYEDTETGVVYTFNRNSGELTGIDNLVDNSSIVVEHREQDYPVLFRHSNGRTLNITYTDSGLISYADLLDEDGNIEKTSLYSYDVSGQFLTMVTVGLQSATYTYSDEGDLLSVVYASGERRTLHYDENNLLSASESYGANDDLIASMRLTNSWNGKVLMTIQPYNRTVQLVYNTFGDVISATTEDGIPLTQVELPGSNGHMIIEGDEVISQDYLDEETNTVYQTSADGNQIAYRFGETGNLMSYTDSEGNAYNTVYDIEGKITEFQNPDETKTMLSYDNKGLVSGVVNPDGSEIVYSYDSDDKMIQKDTGSERISYEYDTRGRLTRGTNGEGTMQIIYGNNGAPVQVVYPSGRILTYGYNDANQRVYIADNNGYNVTYSYDGKSRLSEIRHGSNGELVAAFEYGDKGEVVRKTLGNGAYTTYHYLGDTRHLGELRNYLPNGILSSKFLYTYDRKGKITSMTSVSGNWTYTYDSTGQLVKWTSPNDGITEVTYDSRGNRIVQTRNAQQAGYTTNNMNQYMVFNETDTFTYDPNGNLRQKNAGGRMENFVFDSEGKLAETETPDIRCSYHYDVLGNLYRKNCSDFKSFWYLVDPFGQFGADIVAEISDIGTTYFVNSFEQGLVAAMNGSMFYYEFDGDGSVLSVMDNQGGIRNSYRYDPFGKVLWQSEQIRNIFQYVGRFGVIRDLELQSVFMMRARHYDAEHGRFISMDPIGVAGKSTNLYLYAGNSPMLIKDPTGRILPLVLLGKAALGAAGSVAVYYATAAITGSDTSLGGALGAAASGAIGGPAFGLGKTALKKIAEKVVLPALGGFTGTLVENAVDSKPLNYWEAAQAALFNVVTGNLPTKYLGHTLNKFIPKSTRQFLNRYKNLGWYNSIKPLLKRFLGTRPGKVLMKLAKDTFTSLWKNYVQPLWNAPFEWIVSMDPNDILGPAGFGDAHFIPPDQILEYRIRFENDPNATAPAQRVFIRHQLDGDLDVRTFRIGDFGFGDFTRAVILSRPFLQELVNVTASHGVFVRVRAGINVVTSEATWELQALDPETGEVPVDPSIGFLPPNNGTDGQGYVSFSVRAREQVSSLVRIDATASIIFDQNEPIDTPPIFNTIDSSIPTLNLTVIPDLLYNGTLALQLHKFDTGSGVDGVDIFQLTRANDSAVQEVKPLVLGTKDSVAVLALSPGSQYQVFASAVDNVGNRRSLEEDMQNFVTIDFPSVEGLCPNNCSGRGICTEFSTCQCSPGYYASDCSQDTPPVEPPVLTISSLGGAEDIPVPIRLSASDAASTSTTGVVVKVVTFPAGSTFSRGTFDGNSWTFNSADFGDIELTLPQHLSGEILLRATASKAGAAREGVVRFPIQAVADPPDLSVGDVCYESAVSSINLPIQSSLVDNDGSETLSVLITGIPENATLSVGQRNGSNEYTLSAQDLANVQLQFTGSFQPVNVTVTAMSRELLNEDTAYTSASMSIELCAQSGVECEDGYTVDEDGKNCIDVDECANNTHLCDQICTNTLGSYTCSCNLGYLLHYNGTSCHAVLHGSTIIIAAVIPGVIVAVLVIILLVCCCCCCGYCVRREGKYKSGIAGMGIANRNFEGGIAGMGVVNPTSEGIVVNPVFEEDHRRYDVKSAF